jgi:ankyrin repeat protein
VSNRNGESALHLCVGKQPNVEMARLLMMNGASALVKNALGETPMSTAKRCGNHELVMLLSEPPK